jgi:hypothetical protein
MTPEEKLRDHNVSRMRRYYICCKRREDEEERAFARCGGQVSRLRKCQEAHEIEPERA